MSAEGRAVRERTGLFRAALFLLPLQIVFRGGEAVMPLLLAAWFGRTRETDLYYLLAAYFVFATSLVTGAFQDSAVVPVLVELRAKAPEDLPRVAGALLGHTLVIGAALAAAAGLLAAGVSLATSAPRALPLVLAMSVGVVASAARAFYVGLSNALGRYSAPPVASGVGVALTLVVIAAGRGALGVLVVPFGVLLGEGVAIALLATVLKKGLALDVRPHLGRPEPIVRIFRLLRLEVTGSLITRINPVLDQIMSRMTRVVGGGTLLLYATQVASLPTSVLQATLLPIFLTRLSEEAAHLPMFRETLRRTVLAVMGILAASAAVVFGLRAPICRLLFAHGEMDEAGALAIAQIVPWALLGVVPFGVLLLLARAHVARQNSRIMPSMGVLNAVCNAALNLLFVGKFGLGGIALSTSATYVIVSGVFWARLPRGGGHVDPGSGHRRE
jgi:putative peptidoglycan lipid II flippase